MSLAMECLRHPVQCSPVFRQYDCITVIFNSEGVNAVDGLVNWKGCGFSA